MSRVHERYRQTTDGRATVASVNVSSLKIFLILYLNKSSAVAEMGDRGHNRHGPKRGAAAVPLPRGAVTRPV